MIIGIGGCSRSGKTTLAEKLVWHFRAQNKTAIALHQDDFVKALHAIPLIRDRTDWETPHFIDFDLLKKSIVFFKQDFDVLVMEGILAFADDDLNALYDCCFFTHISEETFRSRKAADKRWGKEPAWYINYIWESFLKYGQPAAELKKLMVIDGEKPYQMGEIEEFLRHFDK